MRVWGLLALLVACHDSVPPISLSGPPEVEPALRDLVELTPYDGLRIAAPGDGFSILCADYLKLHNC